VGAVETIIKRILAGELDAGEVAFFVRNPHFVQRPVSAERFVIEKEFLNTPEAWPEIRAIITRLFAGAEDGKRFSNFSEFVFDGGIGSGKSFIVSIIFCYVVYWLQCLESPQKFFGLAPGSTICLINTSTTASQAKRVVFGKISARISSSPWFQKYALPDPHIKSELKFPKDIVIFPGSSSETAPIGYDVLVANVDEASFFDETDAKSAAAEVFDALQRRIESRFGDEHRPEANRGLIAVTSSPRYVDDFTEKKFEESQKHPDTMLGFRRPTWEMRPDDRAMIARGDCFELEHPTTKKLVKIPLKYLKAFQKNPRKAWRDFGAAGSLVLEAFFTEEEIIKIDAAAGASTLPPAVIDGKLNPDLKPRDGARYRIHIDLGIVRDACGVAMAESEDGERVAVPLILRIVSELRARELDEKGEPYDMIIGRDQVDIDQVLELIYELAGRGFFIELITFDNFQSIHSRQRLEKKGFASDTLSVDKDTGAYDTPKSVIRMDRFTCCPHVFFPQACHRSDVLNGKKVDHPANGSKYLADAGARSVRSCLEQFDDDAQEEETVVDDSVRVDITQEI